MENTAKFKFFITIVSLSALSILFIAECRRRRRRQNKKRPRSSCYLRADPKPQFSFKRVLADNSYSAFKHLNTSDSTTKDVGSEPASNSHPYEAEITALMENPKLEFKLISGNFDLEMSESYVWVETELQLKELAAMLSKERVFAVDTEQHSFRSFLGFTALIQVSTQKEDYLVDTIALHDYMRYLCPVFADPSICKVFHGADNDVLWLQRDFHIYVVNLFDTAKACELLLKPQKSLAYLLETYCGVTTNKLLQREDWRQRPLSMEMVQYARTDAHYLLYIANCLVAEMEQEENENSSPDDKFRFVLEASRRSNMTCLQLYTKEIEASPGDSAASSIFSRHLNGQGGISSASGEFQDVVRRLCAWRDLMARVHDESLRYVLSDQAIIAIADKVPSTSEDIGSTIAEADLNVDLSSGLASPSPVVCSHLDDFYCLLQDKIGNPDDIFPMILQNCLGSRGSCRISVFNYALLVNSSSKLTLVSKQNVIKISKHVSRKASRDLFVQKFSCKSPVYHNCRIYANDGRLLCYCDQKKLEWYLCRDLAKVVDENPPAIMLLFEPKGRPEDEDSDFYIQSKKNICVGCGERNHYLRYRIIPSCYRMHFPEHLKSHRSHDIVLLCVDCHEVAHAAAEKHKKQVAEEFGVPLFVRKVVDAEEARIISGSSESAKGNEAGVSPLQLRTAAMALLRHGPRMPSKRREELTEIVMRYFGGREISEEDLERALLVGMSPHERRRLERKKGLSFKHSKESFPPDAGQEKNTRTETSAVPDISAVDTSDTKAVGFSQKEDREFFMVKDVCSPSLHVESVIDEKPSAVVEKNLTSDRSGVSGAENVSSVNVGCYNKSPPNGKVDYYFTRNDGIAHPKHKSKLSLLGHGPHGKQVVDNLLKEYGDNGIRQFCQRWRQVFVEAVHPRFLPAGWDITHSGRRDFGEFSVYNPSHKASGGTKT
ncbi:Exosome component 10 [Morus notabilis]|uniref:Exosome component 10 n=1 Tax=Morus notabilis TaxID=981085 RepID=W9SDI6_9ROSA|nr:protein RRP6-like 3 isoform X2 [Morus notabilis]EXC01253.1 Exosome component 10 [Morus notabilis]